jgi:hypothetical protein
MSILAKVAQTCGFITLFGKTVGWVAARFERRLRA